MKTCKERNTSKEDKRKSMKDNKRGKEVIGKWV